MREPQSSKFTLVRRVHCCLFIEIFNCQAWLRKIYRQTHKKSLFSFSDCLIVLLLFILIIVSDFIHKVKGDWLEHYLVLLFLLLLIIAFYIPAAPFVVWVKYQNNLRPTIKSAHWPSISIFNFFFYFLAMSTNKKDNFWLIGSVRSLIINF